MPTDDAARQPGPASTSASTATNSIDQIDQAATSPSFSYYRQYCFHLAPTFNKFCPMRVRDILRLDQFATFEGQNIFFYLNHPIKWVRVCGVVVNVADYHGRHVYTIDDGSGMAIECVAQQSSVKPASRPDAPMSVAQTAAESLEQRRRADEALGRVLEARGDLYLYKSWNNGSFLQVQIAKHKFLRGTQQEVAFWNKVNSFARDTLSKPWVVDKQTVRACRQAARACKAVEQVVAASVETSVEPAPRCREKKWQIRADPGKAVRDESAQKATEAAAPPPRPRRRKKWQIRPDAPDGDVV